jgi:hypothetical protein
LRDFQNALDGTPEHARPYEQVQLEQSRARVELWKEAGAFIRLTLPSVTARQLQLLCVPAAVPGPFNLSTLSLAL